MRALCGCTVTQSACELDYVVPVRQLFADSVQRLQALCVDCHSKTLRKSAQPTSLSGGYRGLRALRWSSRRRQQLLFFSRMPLSSLTPSASTSATATRPPWVSFRRPRSPGHTLILCRLFWGVAVWLHLLVVNITTQIYVDDLRLQL